MYETYVPITETIVERRPPTIAEIVRQKTDDGARIIDFFLDLMEGRIDDAKLCHRIDAAKQLVKYGSKKAADFIAEHGDEPCDHCESRKRGPRPRKDGKDASPAAGPLHASPPHAQGPFGYDFLTLLTEDFLTVLSAVDEDLMIKLLRAQTRDGGTVIDFLDNVMHGTEEGFKTNHRISAAKELISHILRDEHVIARTVLEVVAEEPRVRPLPGSRTPSPSTGEGWGEGDSPARGSVGADLKPALPGAAWEPCNPATVIPARTVVVPANPEGNPGNTSVVPAKAGFLPQEQSPTQRGRGTGATRPSRAGVHPELNPSVAPAEAGTQGGGGAHSTAANTVHPQRNAPVVPAEAGTQGGGGAHSAAANTAHPQRNAPVVPAEAGTQGGGGVRRVAGRIREKPDAHWHEPGSWDGPIDSTTPGRSPPC